MFLLELICDLPEEKDPHCPLRKEFVCRGDFIGPQLVEKLKGVISAAIERRERKSETGYAESESCIPYQFRSCFRAGCDTPLLQFCQPDGHEDGLCT